MNVKKQALSACLAGTMLLGTLSAPAMALSVDQLTDVKKTDWFYSAVQYVAENDYMIGVSEDKFAPAMEMTRSMFVTVLARLEGVEAAGAKSNFKDVAYGTWYTQAVNWAAENGIVQGNGEGMFLPDALITRQDMCTMMARYVAYHEKKHNVTHEKKGEAKTFADKDQISSYALEAVNSCVTWGLIEGNELGYFMPLNTSTRAEAGAIISRLTWKSNESGGSIGGGGGGGGDVTKTASYGISVKLDVPSSPSTTDPELLVNYSNVTIRNSTVSGDKTFGQVGKDLVSGENANVLSNAINEAMNKVKGKTFAQTVNGQQVTVSISKDGVVSASVAVKVTDITGKTRASQAELEALISKLQNGGEMSFTKDELLAMDELLNKAEQVKGMSDKEIQDKIDQVVAEKPELEQVVSGMTPEAVRDAAADYQTQVEDVLTDIGVDRGNIASLPDDYTSTEITKEPVLMNVAMDLGAYYDQAMEKFEDEANKDKAISRMESELGLTFTASQKAKAEAVYDLNNPAKYVTDNNDGTLTLKASADYLKLIQDNVSATADFYASLGQDETFYKGLLERLENKYQDGYGVTYTGSLDDMAALLGDKDGILVDGTTFRSDMTFSVTVEVNKDTYSAWRDLIAGKWSQASALPEVMPDALKDLMGTYTLTFTIDKK